MPDNSPLEKARDVAKDAGAGELTVAPDSDQQQRAIREVVLIIHGINDDGAWQSIVEHTLERSDRKVIGVKYRYFDVVRFLAPLFFRKGPQKKVLTQLTGAQRQYPNASLSVIAHSFGGHLITTILKDESFLHLRRLVLCGCVVDQDFDWGLIAYRLGDPADDEKRPYIINECGNADYWPAIGGAVGWRYGNAGTYGFGNAFVTDRAHTGNHSFFQNANFVKEYWLPLFDHGTVVPTTAQSGSAISSSVTWLARLPLRWIVLCALLLFFLTLAGTPTLYFSGVRPRTIIAYFRSPCVTEKVIGELGALGLTVDKDDVSKKPPAVVQIKGTSISLADTASLGAILRQIDCEIALQLVKCNELVSLRGLEGARLLDLDAAQCGHLTELWQPGTMPSLTLLTLSHADALRSFRGCSGLPRLRELSASRCSQINDLTGLTELPALYKLTLKNCGSLTNLNVGGELRCVRTVDCEGCVKLNSLAGLAQLPELEYLDISGCDSLTTLETLPALPRLQTLVILDNDMLADVSRLKALRGLRNVWATSADLRTKVQKQVSADVAVNEGPSK